MGIKHRPTFRENYHPDWVVVQGGSGKQEVNWIIETKGRKWEGTDANDEAIGDWCTRISQEIGQTWKYARIDQIVFDGLAAKTLSGLVDAKDVNSGTGLFR